MEKKKKKRWSKLKYVLLISLTLGLLASATSDFFEYDAQNQTMTHLGITYKFMDNCVTEIWKDGKKVGVLGKALSGTANGEDYHKLASDYTCVWTNSTKTVEEGGENITTTTLTGYNQRPNFNWTQEWVFNENADPKITDYITNDLVDISNFKFWFINTIPKNTIIRYNEKEYMVGSDDDYFGSGNFNNVLPSVEIEEDYSFRYGDLINNGFNITNIVVTKGDFLKLPNDVYIMAVGVTKGNRNFNKGMSISLDPSVTDYKFPTTFGNPETDWTLAGRVGASDDSRASETVLNSLHDTATYDFGTSSTGSTIHGIEVRIEAQGACQAGCGINPRATLSVRMSWDGGTTYTIWKNPLAYRTVNDVVRTVGNLSDTWGRTWVVNDNVDELNDTNFRLQFNYSVATNGGNFEEFEDGGVDAISIRINFTSTPANLTWQFPTPINGSDFGATMRLNATSDVLLDNPNGCLLTLDRYQLDGTIDIANRTSITFDATNNRMTCEYLVPNEIINNASLITGNSKHRIQMTPNPNNPQVGDSAAGQRDIFHNQVAPEASFISPANASTFASGNKSMILNFTINDTNNDFIETTLWITNDSDFLDEGRFVYQQPLPISGDPDLRTFLESGNYLFNFTFSPLLSNHDFSEFEAFYLMNNDSKDNETMVYDYSGNDHNGTLINTSWFEDGRFGFGLNYSGGNPSHMQIGTGVDFATLCLDSGCTVSFWTKPSQHSGDIFFQRYTTGSNEFLRIGDVAGPTNNIRFDISGDGTSGQGCIEDATGDGIIDGRWNHVVGTWINATNTIKIYVNGVEEGSSSCAGSFSEIDATAWNVSESTSIGKTDQASMDAVLDYVFVSNRSYNSSDVQALFELKPGTYYWNISVDDTNVTQMNESTYQFTIEDLVTDSCTYSSGDFDVLCSDNCVITTNVDVGGNDMSILGDGSFTVDGGNITGILDELFGTPGGTCDYLITGGGSVSLDA